MSKEIFNGSHREENKTGNYFEWWYFHFVTSDGDAINFVIHETDIFGIENTPYFSISSLSPSSQPFHAKENIPAGSISRNTDFLKIKDVLTEDENELKFSLKFKEKQTEFSGIIKKITVPLAIEKGILFENDGLKSHWVINIPYATFKGTLVSNNYSKKLVGLVYQDHQWGNILIQDWVEDWSWGHFSDENRAFVFFKIKSQDNKSIDRIAIIDRNSTETGTSVITTYLDDLRKKTEIENTTINTTVSSAKSQKISFIVKPDLLMRKRIREKHKNFEFSYFRWGAVANFTNSADNQPQAMTGITEYLQVKK